MQLEKAFSFPTMAIQSRIKGKHYQYEKEGRTVNETKGAKSYLIPK